MIKYSFISNHFFFTTKTHRLRQSLFQGCALSLTAFALVSCGPRMDLPADVEYDTSISPYHVVKRGDSIASIARQYRMDRMELIRLNGLKTPFRIVIGQRLLVRPVVKKIGRTIGKPTGISDTPQSTIIPSQPSLASQEPAGPVNMGGVEVAPLKPLPGTEAVAVEPAPHDIPGSTPLTPEGGAPAAEEPQKAAVPAVVPSAAKTYQMPVQGRIVRPFAPGKNGNDGINISAPKGTPVVAANNGVVAHAGNQLRGFGNVVLIKHDNGMMSVYAHMDHVNVKKGDTVKIGQKIGSVGKTGTVREPQLHFEMRKGTTPVDPNGYLG